MRKIALLVALVVLAIPTAHGIVQSEDGWHNAEWISCDRRLDAPSFVPHNFMGAWIRSPGTENVTAYRTKFELPDKPVVRALAWWGPGVKLPCAIVANGRDRFFKKEVGRGLRRVDMAFELVAGENTLEIRFSKPEKSPHACFGMRVRFADGAEQIIRSDSAWTAVTEGGPSVPVLVAANYGDESMEMVRVLGSRRLAPAWFRTTVEVGPGLKKATLRHCGLGYGDAYINGDSVSDRVLSPPQTDYEALAMFETDDVTRLLRLGKNAIAIHLASGWFHQSGGFGHVFSYGKPRLRAALELTYENGSTAWVVSDPTWQWKESHIVESNIYSGEIVDYRKADREWAAPEAGSNWQSAVSIESPTKKIDSC
jgi:hypothetical protein